MATIKFENEKKQVQIEGVPGFGFIDCTDDDDDSGFSSEIPASRGRKRG